MVNNKTLTYLVERFWELDGFPAILNMVNLAGEDQVGFEVLSAIPLAIVGYFKPEIREQFG